MTLFFRSVFLSMGANVTWEFLKNQKMSYEKRLQIVFCENNTNRFREVVSLVGCSISAVLLGFCGV